ncbi:NfeD family protein [Terriglobus roseus]|uniref:Nodulation efficiency protein NfeD n=1 Tax=Terriglobus roseus TaxID=392734 RepID=A0A1H4QEL6_9BACT|nr:NfeD family protein [Terriglobus roseus]SEC17932.1 Nodulation efficiency protein NfeD [Terriglobus roseus]
MTINPLRSGLFAFLTLVAGITPRAIAAPRPPATHVDSIALHDSLQPVRARTFAAAIDQANHDGAVAVLVALSTPGGMDSAADIMVAAMRNSRVPIIVWVDSPRSRVTGEGLRLLAEADVALMHPGARLSPLWTEPTRGISDTAHAAGSARLAANLGGSLTAHGRSLNLVTELSTGNHWFPSDEALTAGLIDGTATLPADALRFAGSHPIHRRSGIVNVPELATSGLTPINSSSRDALLLSLMNPDLAVLLLTLGLLLIYLEINTPGTIVPGAAGLTLVLLAAYGLHMLPLNGGGVLLCVLAAVLLLWEARVPRNGVVAVLGVGSLAIGLGLLVRGPVPALAVSWGTAIGAGFGFGGVTACLLVLGAQARRAKVKTGSEAMLGWLAVAQTALAPEGQILVRGELWQARLTSNVSFVAAGDRVKVLRADGLTLEVTAVPLTQFP